MLFLQCHPSSGNRSLGILNVLMSWPGFDMKSSLLAQVVKLEEGFRKGKDKSKSDRSYETGKGKGKDARDKGKGKYGGKQGGKQGGQQTHEGKGKGVSNKASQKGACFTCGHPGFHLWTSWAPGQRLLAELAGKCQVCSESTRRAKQSRNPGGDTPTEPQSNLPANASSSSSQVGAAKGGPSRIAPIAVNSEHHFAPIFDLKNDEPNTTSGQCINAIQFYIGDDGSDGKDSH